MHKKKASQLIQSLDIPNVITTSPPHSTQLIGLKLKKKFKSALHWIVDFRDPWTDIYDYSLLNHSWFSKTVDAYYEKNVLEKSDATITVGSLFKQSFMSKTNRIEEQKISIITNGYDPDDFQLIQKKKSSKFIIAYVGTISDYYQPEVFFTSLSEIMQKYKDIHIQFKLIGIVSECLRYKIQQLLGDSAIFLDPVSHEQAIQYMVDSDLLVLITQGDKGTIPGKTFEYLASGNRIIGIGKGDSADIISQCNAGASFDREEASAIVQFLDNTIQDFINKQPIKSNREEILQWSRAYQAKQVFDLCIE